MKFKIFLEQEESIYSTPRERKEITVEEAKELIKKNVPFYDFKKQAIYRGTSNRTTTPLISSPGKGRVSSNTGNLYTLLIDNSPYWKEYPKRSESFICTTDKGYADTYGWKFLVIPLNKDAKIGICGADDLWNSFPKLLKKYFNDPVGELSNVVYYYRRLVADLLNEERPATTYEELKKQLKRLSVALLDDKKVEQVELANRVFIDYFVDLAKNKVDLLTQLQKDFAPQNEKFSVTTFENFVAPRGREVWTDAACLFIPLDFINVPRDILGIQ